MTAPYLVHGKKATKNEFNVAAALDYYELDYMFRVSYFGGHSLVGGIELDFLVNAPFKTPLEVYGNYFHEGQMANKDRYRQIILERFFNQPLKIIWGSESETFDQARTAVRRVLGL